MLRVTRKKRKGEEKESESFPLGIEIWGIFNGQPSFVYTYEIGYMVYNTAT